MNLIETDNLVDAQYVIPLQPYERSGLIDGKLYDIRIKELHKVDWDGNPYIEEERYVIDENGKENFGIFNSWCSVKLYRK